MNKPKIAAVAFDMDGLMINSEELYRESGSDMIRARGKEPVDGVFHAMMGRTNLEALRILKDWYSFDDSVEALFEETERRMDALLANRLQAMPGLLELLDVLETKSIPKAVTTSGTRPYLNRVLSDLNLTERFAFSLTAEDVSNGKPNPEIYIKAAERFEVTPGQLMVLEDSNHGNTAAVAAGAVAVAVPTEYTGALTADVYLVADSLSDKRIVELLK